MVLGWVRKVFEDFERLQYNKRFLHQSWANIINDIKSHNFILIYFSDQDKDQGFAIMIKIDNSKFLDTK